MLVIVAVAALLGGLLIGWLAGGASAPDAIRADGEALTDRQQDMVDALEESVDGWKANDSAAVLAFYTPDAEAEFLGSPLRADDGTLADYIESGDFDTLDIGRILVEGNRIVYFHDFQGGTYLSEMQFTADGEPLLFSHIIRR